MQSLPLSIYVVWPVRASFLILGETKSFPRSCCSFLCLREIVGFLKFATYIPFFLTIEKKRWAIISHRSDLCGCVLIGQTVYWLCLVCLWDMCPMSGPGRLGFDQILWINKEKMKRKFHGLLACVQHWGKRKGKMMRIRGCFSRGFSCVSANISCLAHLSEEREALALTPDPGKAASIAARHSHAIWGRGGVCQEAG